MAARTTTTAIAGEPLSGSREHVVSCRLESSCFLFSLFQPEAKGSKHAAAHLGDSLRRFGRQQ